MPLQLVAQPSFALAPEAPAAPDGLDAPRSLHQPFPADDLADALAELLDEEADLRGVDR